MLRPAHGDTPPTVKPIKPIATAQKGTLAANSLARRRAEAQQRVNLSRERIDGEKSVTVISPAVSSATHNAAATIAGRACGSVTLPHDPPWRPFGESQFLRLGRRVP